MIDSTDDTLFQDLLYHAEQLDMETMYNIFGGCEDKDRPCGLKKDYYSGKCDEIKFICQEEI